MLAPLCMYSQQSILMIQSTQPGVVTKRTSLDKPCSTQSISTGKTLLTIVKSQRSQCSRIRVLPVAVAHRAMHTTLRQLQNMNGVYHRAKTLVAATHKAASYEAFSHTQTLDFCTFLSTISVNPKGPSQKFAEAQWNEQNSFVRVEISL